jgi:hypothetical protein
LRASRSAPGPAAPGSPSCHDNNGGSVGSLLPMPPPKESSGWGDAAFVARHRETDNAAASGLVAGTTPLQTKDLHSIVVL